MTTPNIYQRINAVMKAVNYAQKDTTVSGGGTYKAVSHDMITAILRPQLVEHGIVVRVQQQGGSILQMRDPKQDIKMHLYAAEYIIDFVNIRKVNLF